MLLQNLRILTILPQPHQSSSLNQLRCAVAFFGIFLPACGHASPSFDCNKAKTPIEVLICAIPELTDLDKELADAFEANLRSAAADTKTSLQASQLSWLEQRDSACHVPSNEAEFPITEWNAMAICTADRYRKKLSELQPSADTHTATANLGGLIHPLCLVQILESNWTVDIPDPDWFSLEACSAEHATTPVQISRGEISARDGGYYSYKPVAILPDGRQLLIQYDGGARAPDRRSPRFHD